MASLRPSLLLPILVLVAALPASAALFLYKYTGDPSLRPLGVTKNSLSDSDTPQALLEILVRVDWGKNVDSSVSQDDFRNILGKALSIYSIDFRIQFRERSGRTIEVTYIIRNNQIGPYPMHRASQGIPAALAAFKAMSPKP